MSRFNISHVAERRISGNGGCLSLNVELRVIGEDGGGGVFGGCCFGLVRRGGGEGGLAKEPDKCRKGQSLSHFLPNLQSLH